MTMIEGWLTIIMVLMTLFVKGIIYWRVMSVAIIWVMPAKDIFVGLVTPVSINKPLLRLTWVGLIISCTCNESALMVRYFIITGKSPVIYTIRGGVLLSHTFLTALFIFLQVGLHQVSCLKCRIIFLQALLESVPPEFHLA
jgi:hypothetical protein